MTHSLDAKDAKAIIFDMDDTLVDWHSAQAKAIAALAREHLAAHDERTVAAAYHEIMQRNMESYQRTGIWWFVRDRMEMLAARFPADPDELSDTFLASARAHLEFLPGAREALDAARRGRRVAILTNGPPEVQRPKIDRFALAEAVDVVAISGEIGHWKPDPQAFLHVLAELGVAPEEAVMVGDSPFFDLAPAKRLGMRTVRIDREERPDAMADLVVRDPAALLPYL